MKTTPVIDELIENPAETIKDLAENLTLQTAIGPSGLPVIKLTEEMEAFLNKAKIESENPPRDYCLDDLISDLTCMRERYGGDVLVDLLTDTGKIQTEQQWEEVKYSSRQNRIKLLPKDF